MLVRSMEGDLLEVKAVEATKLLETDLSLLQILLHAQHEGVLTYGDIRFGSIRKVHSRGHAGTRSSDPAGRGAFDVRQPASDHTSRLRTRQRTGNAARLVCKRHPCMVVHGIAGIGKSTLIAHWLQQHMETDPHLSVCWYTCQPWDRALGLATSLLHRFGIDESHDPYRIIETLPLTPGADMDVDAWRRRLTAYMTDANTIRERFKDTAGGPPPTGSSFSTMSTTSVRSPPLARLVASTGAKGPLRILLVSRTELSVYDRRDVHIRDTVRELPLKGLSLEATQAWLSSLKAKDAPPAEEVPRQPEAILWQWSCWNSTVKPTHKDWLRFLDEEILLRLPEQEKELLATLAVAESPVPWKTLADGVGWNGTPPDNLLKHGLLLELEEGMWLHEALRERLLRDVGDPLEDRKNRLA